MVRRVILIPISQVGAVLFQNAGKAGLAHAVDAADDRIGPHVFVPLI